MPRFPCKRPRRAYGEALAEAVGDGVVEGVGEGVGVVPGGSCAPYIASSQICVCRTVTFGTVNGTAPFGPAES